MSDVATKKKVDKGVRSGWCSPTNPGSPRYNPHLRCTWGDTCPCECHVTRWSVTWADWEDEIQNVDGWETEADARRFMETLVELSLAPDDSSDISEYRA